MISTDASHDAPRLAALVLAGFVWNLGCQRPEAARELAARDNQVINAWDQIFAEREIELRLPETGPPLLRIAQVLVGREGNLIIPDGRAKRILVFDSEGTLVREIQGGDDGSFELSVLGPLALDPEGNLLVLDPDGGWATILEQATDRVLRRFQISAPATVLLVLRDGSIVTYFPADETVFKKFDRAGKQIAAAHRARDENLRIFHGRVQTGGITQSSNGDLFGLHPSAFELVRLSPDLEALEFLRGAKDDHWAPQPPDFPPGLNPYEYRPAHEEWWDSFTHIGRPYALMQDLLLVTLFASRGLAETQDFANIYRVNGDVVAQGLRVPHEGRIVGAAGESVYVVRNAHLGDSESIEPLKFYEYRLRDLTP